MGLYIGGLILSDLECVQRYSRECHIASVYDETVDHRRLIVRYGKPDRFLPREGIQVVFKEMLSKMTFPGRELYVNPLLHFLGDIAKEPL